jgi:hypothetical protein
VPGTVNLNVKDCPFDSIGELIARGALVVVTVWGASSWLVQVMLSPAVTVRTCGANAKFAIWTLRLVAATGATGTSRPAAAVRSPRPAEARMPAASTTSASNGDSGRGPEPEPERPGFARRGVSGRVIGSPPRA